MAKTPPQGVETRRLNKQAMSTPQGFRIDQVRAIFASIDDPARLRDLPLVAEMLAAVDDDPAPSHLCAAVRHRIDTVIESLDSRARTILVRCDIGRETHRAVAADLGIGERYFYRERRRALADLGAGLTVAANGGEADPTAQPHDLLLAAATAAHNGGRLRDATSMLAAAYAAGPPAAFRAALALRLAHLALDAGNAAEARTWIGRGRRDVAALADAPAESAIASCELDLAEVRAAVADDDFERADDSARAVTRRLRALSSHRHRDRIAAALSAAYVALSEARIMRGSFSSGLDLALEGRASLQRTAAFAPAAEIDALIAIAQARTFANGSLARAGADFGVAYSRAVALGMGRDAAKVAASLALVSAVRGDHPRSVSFTRVAQTVGRRLVTPSERVSMNVDLAAGALARNDIAGARAFLADAVPTARGILASVLVIINAEIHLADGQPQAARGLAQRAGREFAALGNKRFLGSAHRIEAEACAAIGKRSAAAERISDALECLHSTGNPIALSRAFALSARVTGNRRHRASAREFSAAVTAYEI